ncbi:hypothetical protein NQ317_007914 [Molorchus minor]|uniref:C2H2-type domain-containing protein n=1 Tax=Molorchus minor TaxID=1323400 RepID=A0ABQ9JS81_9CUCU|nr:hypothetical protein NQ317_007914 [Molorchus minor]
MYYSLVESHIHYGIVGWGVTSFTQKAKYSMSDRFFLYKMLILQHKKRTDLIPIQHEYNTRHKKIVKTKTIKLTKTLGQRSFLFLAPHIYRRIPEKLKLCKTIHRGNLTRHLLVHKDISEVQMFKCEICDFLTKRRDALKSHKDNVSAIHANKCLNVTCVNIRQNIEDPLKGTC